MSASESATSRPTVAAWVVVMAISLLLGLQPIATDLYLPAMPQMQQAMGLQVSSVQWTLSALILAFGFGQLIWGPVADRFGRQPVLRWGLGAFVLASVVATVAPTLHVLIAARAAQGACLAAAVVCGRAMIRDLYEPEEGARMMSRGLSGLGLLALSGPILGGLTATYSGWRATMAVIGLFGLAAWAFVWWHLPETLPAARRKTDLNWARLLREWREIFAHKRFRAYTMLTSSTYGGLYVYLALSAFVFIDVVGISRTAYGACMATLSLSYLAGTIMCRRILPKRGLTGTVRLAGWCTLTGGLIMGGLSAYEFATHAPIHAWMLLPGLWLYAFAHGIHQPCGQTGTVSAFPGHAGAASALSGFLLSSAAFVIGALLSWWTAQPAWAHTIHPMALGVFMGGLMTGWVALFRVQRDGHLFDEQAAP
jgi:MFS transporter, DHA1 family, multidrug resistance protein